MIISWNDNDENDVRGWACQMQGSVQSSQSVSQSSHPTRRPQGLIGHLRAESCILGLKNSVSWISSSLSLLFLYNKLKFKARSLNQQPECNIHNSQCIYIRKSGSEVHDSEFTLDFGFGIQSLESVIRNPGFESRSGIENPNLAFQIIKLKIQDSEFTMHNPGFMYVVI